MGTLIQDLRFGHRMLVKNPGFTAVAVITLALGIGAATTIFSVIYNVLLDPFPYTDAERFVFIQIHDVNDSGPYGRMAFSVPSPLSAPFANKKPAMPFSESLLAMFKIQA